VLDGKESELRPHLNHQVRISGQLDSTPSGAAASTTTGGATTSATPPRTTSSSAMSGSKTASPHLRVESVQMVSSTCPSR
jgi:hypothetical protein